MLQNGTSLICTYRSVTSSVNTKFSWGPILPRKGNCGEGAGNGCKPNAATRVFEAARDLFYSRGVRAVGVDEIVAQAGVTKPSLYRAYASKDELVAACLKDSGDAGRAAVDAAIACAGSCPEAQLRAVLRHFAGKIDTPSFRGCPLSNTAVEFPEPGHPGRPVLEACKAELRTELVAIARRLAGRDPDILADGLMLLIEGAMASHHVFGSQGPSSALIAAGDRLIDSYLETGSDAAGRRAPALQR